MNKWPSWLKTIWWIIITLGLSLLMYKRIDNFINGTNTTTDIVILFILFALYLSPLFQEIELPGLKLKNEINEVKKEVEGIRNQIKNSQDLHSIISPNFMLNTPPSDASLPKIEEQIKIVIKETLSGYGFSENYIQQNDLSLNENITYLFTVRYHIEKELRDLAEPFMDNHNRFYPIYKIIELLVSEEIINRKLSNSIRELYSVCSPAIHGEEISDNQFKFVKETASEIIGTLRIISKNTFINERKPRQQQMKFDR